MHWRQQAAAQAVRGDGDAGRVGGFGSMQGRLGHWGQAGQTLPAGQGTEGIPQGVGGVALGGRRHSTGACTGKGMGKGMEGMAPVSAAKHM